MLFQGWGREGKGTGVLAMLGTLKQFPAELLPLLTSALPSLALALKAPAGARDCSGVPSMGKLWDCSWFWGTDSMGVEDISGAPPNLVPRVGVLFTHPNYSTALYPLFLSYQSPL